MIVNGKLKKRLTKYRHYVNIKKVKENERKVCANEG